MAWAFQDPAGMTDNGFIRPVTPEDALQHAFVVGYSFSEDRTERGAQAFSRHTPLEWVRGLYRGGRLVAALSLLPYTLYLEGRAVRTGGIADVACLPEERRRGHVGRLLRQALAEMRDRHMPVAALYTPHVPLYRRFGWEVATQNVELRFPIKRTPPRLPERPAGAAERIGALAWRRLDALYAAAIEPGNSGLSRWEGRWGLHAFAEQDPQDVAVWVSPDGTDRGYAIYRETGWHNFQRGDLRVREVVALDSGAYRGLASYLLQHDLAQDAVWQATPADPALQLFDDPGQLSLTLSGGLLLRIVDLPVALAARPCYAPAPMAFTLAVRDSACAWNAGTWRIAGEAGRLSATPSTAEPDLSLDCTTLAALYNGGLAPATAARAGLIAVQTPTALETAHDLFAMRCAPACLEHF